MAKVAAGSDAFITEKYHDEVAKILASWTVGLLESPANLAPISAALSPAFVGSSLHPADSKLIRKIASNVEVYKDTYSNVLVCFHGFQHMYTAEFQVTSISGSPENLRTTIRFDLVGSGPDFHREQRSGQWNIEWENFRVRKWLTGETIRGRSLSPCFEDIASHAFAEAPSFLAQLSHGVDYWRTTLDAACGIDIYGHNGVSVGDINGDGYDDLYVCQPAGLPNRLFRNGGNGTFEDVTEHSGVGLLDNTACALFADFRNSGTQDLVVVRATGPLLFLNDGKGKFSLKQNAFKFATPPQGTFTGAAAADYNRDGFLDIYFCLYTYYQGTNQYNYPSPYFDAQNGPPNFLLHNNGDGTFRDVTAETGLNRNNTRFSFCCGWGDFNGNGWPDLYVVNDFGRKNLYRNNGDGTFSDIASEAGAEDIGAGMSVSWLDYNNDGKQDLYVANMWTAAGLRVTEQAPFLEKSLGRKHAMGNSLLRNTGGGHFEDATSAASVGMGRWSWSSDTLDFDHDGYPDLYVANGMLSGPNRDDLNSFFWRQVVANSGTRYEQGWNAINELIRSDHTWSGYERNVAYVNNQDGTFSDVSGALGLDFLEDGRAFALADFNHDGRQEILLKNRNGPQLRLLQNVVPELPPSISFRLTGTGKSNRDAIGAAVTVGRQTKYLQAGSGFLSQHSKDLFFGLGDLQGPVSVSVRWPSGSVQKFDRLPVNSRVSLQESIPDPTKVEPFKPRDTPRVKAPQVESLPTDVETWLISPIMAPDLPQLRGKPAVIYFGTTAPVSSKVAILSGDDAVYNLLYRYLFDRHRDISVPTCFLLNAQGEIVKVYQGAIDVGRLEYDAFHIPSGQDLIGKALPFAGVSSTFEYQRNHLTLGTVFYQHGCFEQARTFFHLAVRDDPDSAETHYGLGSALLSLNQSTEAQQAFEQAVKLKAGYPDTISNAWNNLGLLATRNGKLDDAISDFQSALRGNPDYAIALLNLGNAYRQSRQWPEARSTLEHALKVNAEDPEANYSLAMVFAQTDDQDRAYEYLQKALKYRPGYPEALNNLGVLYLRTRRRDDAVKAFQECIQVAPDFNQSYLNLARVYAIEGDAAKARALVSEFLQRHPDDRQAKLALEQLP